ncbi:hypothetical protein V8E54_000850 [Elaphomyces granulatus]
MDTTTPRKKVLSTPKDWDEWFLAARDYAMDLKVWELVNPDVEHEPILAFKPRRPEPKDVRKGQPEDLENQQEQEFIDYPDLAPIELTILQLMQKNWEYDYKQWEIKDTGLKEFRKHLNETVSSHHIQLSLKSMLCPSHEMRRQEVLQRYYALKHYPRGEDLCLWVDKWIRIESELKNARCIELNSMKSDFISVNQLVSESYTTTWEDKFHEDSVTFVELAQAFRNHYQRNAYKRHATRSTFQATLNGKKPEEDKPEADYGKKKDTRPCLCGEIHRFSQCLYFIPSLRPANWTEDLEIRKKIDATLRDKPSLRNAIRVARQGVKNAEKKKNSGEGNGSHTSTSATDHSTPSENFSAKHVTFNTHRFTGFTQSDYALRKSFIADNAADTHVINHHYRNRLVNFRPGIPGDSLLHGNSSSQVAGYGDATVYTKDENGMQVKLTIKDVIYVPDFHTNIVSLKPHLAEELREEVEDIIRTIEVPEPASTFGYMDFSDDVVVSNQPDHPGDTLDTTTISQAIPESTDRSGSGLTDKTLGRYGSTHLLTPAETPEPMAEHVDAEQPDLSTIEPHSGEQLQLDSLMDTHGINEQALEDEAGINTSQSESQHSSAPVTTVSADLLPEHIIQGKRIRKPTDRKALI